MPGPTGFDLLNKAKQIDPNLKFILISAYDAMDTIARGQENGVLSFIEKPFTRKDILDAVDFALNCAQPA